jgi:hypothetical protein
MMQIMNVITDKPEWAKKVCRFFCLDEEMVLTGQPFRSLTKKSRPNGEKKSSTAAKT